MSVLIGLLVLVVVLFSVVVLGCCKAAARGDAMLGIDDSPTAADTAGQDASGGQKMRRGDAVPQPPEVNL